MSKPPPGPLVLSIALALLALGAASMAYFFPSVSDITGVTTMEPKGKPTKKIKADELSAGLADWTAPVLWKETASKHPLFDSQGYLFYPSLYPNGNFIQKDDGTAKSVGGVLLSWYKKYGLDIQSSTIDRDDPDGDGFSNIVEYKNEPVGQRVDITTCDGSKATNPLDAQSHPDYLSRLRLQKYESRPFRIRFNGYQELNGTHVYQIRLLDVPSDKQPPLKKTGDKLGFEDYIIGEFKSNIVQEIDPSTKASVTRDRSTLELIKPDIDLHIILPFQQDTDSPESTADFVMLMPSEVDKVYKVARGKILTVPFIPATTAQYLVIEANDDGAKIRDTKTKQDYHILKLIDTEWNEVPLPPANASKSP